MMQATIEFANKGGKVFGVCNGFQIVCEAGLLPGALLKNSNQQFICKNVHIIGSEGKALKIPIAHGEGRYYADEQTIKTLKANNQIIYQYCDVDGNISDAANPNGTMHNIAGVCNSTRNVFGMMPHPERACSTQLANTDGITVFNTLFLQHVQQSVLA
jgi:phosphoribosylformylglycinamidine synthase